MPKKNLFDVIIIGGGPAGLIALAKLEPHFDNVLLLEAKNVLGGQVQALYQEKTIADLRDFSLIKAEQYLEHLINKINPQHFLLNTQVKDLLLQKNKVIVVVEAASFEAKCVVLATGLGFYTPRTLGINGDDASNIHYSIAKLQNFKDREIIIFGGGDSALDWTRELMKVAKKIYLVHRRNEFRGDATFLLKQENVTILTPYLPLSLDKNNEGSVKQVTVENILNHEQLTLNCDDIIVSYGSIPTKTAFNLRAETGNYLINQDFETSTSNIFAIGDAIMYEGKKKRIQPIYDEVDTVIKTLLKRLHKI
ncbi:MAG: NAD(P)/FAD-dependent oxidoreductase [Erysipelotrichaceae bacterium]|jgi:thioredoxin reductase (NADPH)|nr:NAD(P)/FAD-dependent oxidoreductase [Erysipelotrichaceae bacterium]